jgi:hypothetical protein
METQPTRAECAPKPRPRKRGRTLVEAWQRSGLSQRAFAQQQQIKPALVSYWARRFPPPEPLAACAPAATVLTDFVEVSVPRPAPSGQRGSAIEVLLAGGAVVRVVPGVDPALLRIVVSALAGDRC